MTEPVPKGKYPDIANDVAIRLIKALMDKAPGEYRKFVEDHPDYYDVPPDEDDFLNWLEHWKSSTPFWYQVHNQKGEHHAD